MKYTSMDRIFSKIIRDFPPGAINEADIIEWAGEALEHVNAIRAKEEAVAFLKVKNFQTEMPYNLHNIIQIAKNNLIDDPETKPVVSTEDEVINKEEKADYPVCLDCNGMPYYDYDIAYYRPYHDLQYEYNLWRENVILKRCYVPVRLSNNSFFNSLVCSQDDHDCGYDIKWSAGPYTQSTYEYTIIEDKVLRFNFEKGIIALAYNRNMQDKDGVPMIPDYISFTTAITGYIMWQMMKREFYTGREGSKTKVVYAEDQWQWYCKQASNKSLIPQGVDELENLKEQRNYILPRRNVYQNYFGNLNNREVKNILH